MKLKIDEIQLRRRMKEKGFKNLKSLAEYCGLPKASMYNGRSRNQALNKENLWLLSEGLGCTINDIVYPDWEE